MEKEEIILREYETIMSHLLGNWRLRYILVGLNITALGTFGGLAIKMESCAILLLTLMVIVSASLGIVWVGESVWAAKMMNLVRDEIVPVLRKLQRDVPIITPTDNPEREGLTSWKAIKNILTGASPGATSILLLFLLPSLAGWVVAFSLALLQSAQQHWYVWVLVGISALLIYILIRGGITWKHEWTKPAKTAIKEQT